jgi:pimeloyl-ACP methyl ester carboxylesterase
MSIIEPLAVRSADGTTLAVQMAGNPTGQPILFVHGFNQSQRCWMRQFADRELTGRFRLVSFDLRGHGGSEKPDSDAFYREDRRWADDVAAVIAAAGLRRPVIVAWSYGGRVALDYIAAYGAADIGAVNFVAAVTRSGSAFMGPDGTAIRAMCGNDPAQADAATRQFLRACYAGALDPEEFDELLADNLLLSSALRRLVLGRSVNDGAALARLSCPVLVSHGDADRIVLPTLAEFTVAQAPNARLSLYAAAGHAPFVEQAGRFNRELAGLIG